MSWVLFACVGGSSSIYPLDRVESTAFRLTNAPLLTYQLPSLKLRRDASSLFLSLFYMYYFGRCSQSWTIVFLVPKTGAAILGLLPPHMNFVRRCTTCASIVVVPVSFCTQVICGTLYILLPFLPLKICIRSNVGCTGTSEPLFEVFFIVFYYFLNFLNINSGCCIYFIQFIVDRPWSGP